jgi:polysaccharide biosynthesis/export protein
MRVIRTLMLFFGIAITVGGCAQQAVVRYAAPAPQGIDNVVYGATPGYGAVAAPSYATPSYAAPSYAMAAPAPAPVYNTVAAPAYGAPAPAYATSAPVTMVNGYQGGAMMASPYMFAPFAPPAYTLDSGDRLRVVVFGQDGLTNSYVVDASGQIAMPLIGIVPARGLTTDQLSARIADMLRQGYVREPHVAVEVEAYRPFFILGEVAQPGQYPYTPNMTVETAVAIAGGFGPRGLHSPVIITRNYNGAPMRYQAPISAPIRPGDTIQVQERWF